MIQLKTKCKDCIHEKVCRNVSIPDRLKSHIENVNYGGEQNRIYKLGDMTNNYHINIDVSCANFEMQRPVTKRAVDLSNYVGD